MRSIVITILTAVFLIGSGLPLLASEPAHPPVPPTALEVLEGLPPTSQAGLRGLDAGAELSQPTPTPIPFSMVGVEVPETGRTLVRTSMDGKTWTVWEEAEYLPDEGPDPGSPEAAGQPRLSEPIWVGEARWVQTRVEGAGTEDVAVHLVDSLGLSRNVVQRAADALVRAWRGAPEPAAAVAGAPEVVTRAQWGANESYRTGSPSYARRVRFGVVHHTAGSNNYSASEAPAIVRGVYAYHTRSLGWSDIGYNLLIDRYGTVYEGRAGGLDKPVIGAHAGGFNTGSFGVSVMGNFVDAAPPAAAMESLADVLAWKFDVHHIDPLAEVTLTSGGSTRYAAGTKVTKSTLIGHKEVSTTSCPGGIQDRLDWLRQEIVTRAGDVLLDHAHSPATLSALSDRSVGPVTFSTRLRPSGSWELTVTDPSGDVVHRDSGSGTTASSVWEPGKVDDFGRYTYTFASPGRRSASDYFDLLIDLVERVGNDSNDIRAAVQLSQRTFASAGSAQHAVVAREDIFADAMAGGPLAGTAGPILLTKSDGLHSTVRAELERVLPTGRTVYVLGGNQAIDPTVDAWLAQRWKVIRLAGEERTATAAAVAEVVLARSGGSTVMVARAGPDNQAPWADALAGGAYGAARGIPVLLTQGDRLSPATAAALQRLGVTRTYVLGGTQAISEAVAGQLPGATRIAGPDRAATAAAIATQLWGRTTATDGDRFAVTGGWRANAWTRALVASPLAAGAQAPLLLVDGGRMPDATSGYLSGLGYGNGRFGSGLVVGDGALVSSSVESTFNRLLQ